MRPTAGLRTINIGFVVTIRRDILAARIRWRQYKYDSYLTRNADTAFDSIHQPGDLAQHEGIYRCTNCGREIVVKHGTPLPAQIHHQHLSGAKAIRWRLVVFADNLPKLEGGL